MRTLNDWAKRALLVLGVIVAIGLTSCEQELIEPDFTSAEGSFEGTTEQFPQTPCTNCGPD